ncbi:ABC transporter permease [Actinospica sp. MGRD01-02]|uniref:ABC transporter permease n=1 Tax=Actinospica acidithermotolerans TaxID=2828514 RepID=A0A941E4V2_9ACTN|nr:ABC transporter permease [Actinospica acidithermotolerans]MBR7826310.1 ABC transporter permease [Actinospica acidithermotolerans]
MSALATSVFDMPSYVQSSYVGLILTQLEVSLGATLAGLAIALPIGQFCSRLPRLYPPTLGLVTLIYSIPSIALFVLLIDYTGESETTVFIPLTLYTLAILVPGVVDGIRSVPRDVLDAADGMGYGRARRYLAVELPIALPTLMAAVRVAAVSSLSLMSIGATIGNYGGIGDLFLLGLRFFDNRLIWVGLITLLVLSVLCDIALRLVQRLLTPWARSLRSIG